MAHLRTTALATCAFILLSTSCKKEDTADPGSGGGGGGATINKEVLLSVSRNSGAHEEGIASAAFIRDDTLATSMTTVELNNYTLDEFSTGLYIVGFGDNIDFTSGLISWNVLPVQDFPSLTHFSGNVTFPGDGNLISSTTIDKSAGYTFEVSGFPGADSIYVSIGFQVRATLPAAPSGTNFTHTFSAAELSVLSAGTEQLRISGRRSAIETQGSTRIRSDASTSLTISATIVE